MPTKIKFTNFNWRSNKQTILDNTTNINTKTSVVFIFEFSLSIKVIYAFFRDVLESRGAHLDIPRSLQAANSGEWEP